VAIDEVVGVAVGSGGDVASPTGGRRAGPEGWSCEERRRRGGAVGEVSMAGLKEDAVGRRCTEEDTRLRAR
jgi:hypothetical protein